MLSVAVSTFAAYIIPSTVLYFGGSFGGITLSICICLLNASTALLAWKFAKSDRRKTLLKWNLGLNTLITFLLMGITYLVVTNERLLVSLGTMMLIWLGLFNILPIGFSCVIYKAHLRQNMGLTTRILGETPSVPQKVFFFLMSLSLILWPLGIFGSIFFFDAPIRSTIDEFCRYGMLLTIWLYPIYLFPLMRIFSLASKRWNIAWLYCLCPIVPALVLEIFWTIGSLE